MNYEISTTTAVLIGVVAVWEMVWKGFALWKAARNNELGWFVILLAINSAGILPIFYIALSKDRTQAVRVSHAR